MPLIRAAYQVPTTKAAPDFPSHTTRVAIIDTLNTLGYAFTTTPDGAFTVDTPNAGRTHFGPGQTMLFCESGLYRVTPAKLDTLRPGDGILGFPTGREGDIFDAVMVLKHRPQNCGPTVRLVPDPPRCHPATYAFGVVYAPARLPAWKLSTNGEAPC